MTPLFFRRKSKTSLGGFGLVELLVSISIMVMVTSIVLARHSAFNSTILLRSQAYEIALRIREVQLSAVSASDQASGQTRDFRRLYGIKIAGGNTNGTTYQVFTTNSTEAANWEDSLTQVGTLGGIDDRFQITCIQRHRIGQTNPDDCNNNPHHIVFNRPNFDALFFDANGASLNGDGGAGVAIHTLIINVGLRGQQGTGRAQWAIDEERQIVITRAGQITVR